MRVLSDDRPCTLDERSARLIMPGREIVQRAQQATNILAASKIARPMGRARALRQADRVVETIYGDRLLHTLSLKRKTFYVVAALVDGEIIITYDSVMPRDGGMHAVCNPYLVRSVINQHATARLFQRLRTTDLDAVMREIKPYGLGTLNFYAARRSGNHAIEEGRRVLMPTASGHLVVPFSGEHGRPDAVTWISDTSTGSEILGLVQQARHRGVFISAIDRKVEHIED